MKLRNKKTGEIIEFDAILPVKDVAGDSVAHLEYGSLTELNEEWEDYEEPKEYWYYDTTKNGVDKITHLEDKEKDQEIGNYFETKEEAEKAVEKLKAWKRLKDKGFRFDVVPALGHCDVEKFDISIIATMPAKWWYNDKVVDDIHYAFGGEE